MKDLLVIVPSARPEAQVTRLCARDGMSGLDLLLAEDDGLREHADHVRECLSDFGQYADGGGAAPGFILIEVENLATLRA